MSYLTQMPGLAFKNFVSLRPDRCRFGPNPGMPGAGGRVGNFWGPVGRTSTCYCHFDRGALVAGMAGVPQNLNHYVGATGSRHSADNRPGAGGVTGDHQELGTNGGASSMPLCPPVREPNAITNLIEMLAIRRYGGLTYTFDAWWAITKQGWRSSRHVRHLPGGVTIAYGLRPKRTGSEVSDRPGRRNLEARRSVSGAAVALFASSPPSPPAAPSTPCTTASTRSAA